MQLYLKLRWVLRVAKNFVGGSEGTIYSHYFECISVMFPVTFPITFHFRLHNSNTSVGSQWVHQSDRFKISYFVTFVGRVQSQAFKGRSQFGSCLETELVSHFQYRPVLDIRSVGSVPRSKPGVDSTGIHYCLYLKSFYGLVIVYLSRWLTCYTGFVRQRTGGLQIKYSKLVEAFLVVG